MWRRGLLLLAPLVCICLCCLTVSLLLLHALCAAHNRLLAGIQDSVQRLEATVAKEVAFQEGVRYGQRTASSSLLLSVAAAAAAASAVTALVLARRASSK